MREGTVFLISGQVTKANEKIGQSRLSSLKRTVKIFHKIFHKITSSACSRLLSTVVHSSRLGSTGPCSTIIG